MGLLVREHNRAEPCRPRANFENHLADNMNTMTRSILCTLLVAAVAIGADAYGHHSSNAAVDAPEPSSNIIPELEKSMTLNSSAFGSAPIAFAVGVMALLAMLF